MEAGGSQGTLVQGYSGPRKSCKTPSESRPQGRGSDPAPTPQEGHGAGALWYHPKQIREWHFTTTFGEALKQPQTPPVQAAAPTWGGGRMQKKTPLLVLAHSKGFTVGVQNWWSMAAPRMRLHDYLAEGEGHQIQLPHALFLGEKEEENPRDGQSPWEGWKSTRSRGWHRNLSAPVP